MLFQLQVDQSLLVVGIQTYTHEGRSCCLGKSNRTCFSACQFQTAKSRLVGHLSDFRAKDCAYSSIVVPALQGGRVDQAEMGIAFAQPSMV